MSPVLKMIVPRMKRIMKAMPIEPTSPAKHFAFPFGLKLKMQNTSTPMIATIRYDWSMNPSFTKASGTSTASAYRP